MSVFEKIAGSTAALVDLDRRGRLRAGGSDRVRFLDGMVTNSVEALAPGTACVALILDRKGRMLSELCLVELGESILIETSAGTGSAVLEALDRHLVADDVELTDLSEPWTELSIEGPGARAVVGALGVDPPAAGGALGVDACVWLGGGALTDEGLRVLGPRSELTSIQDALGLDELADASRTALRIEGYRPAYGVDVDARTFPAEAPYAHAVSFTKGCYVGQEIVARIDSRGNVHRKLVKLGAERALLSGAEIRVDGASVGHVTSCVVSPASGPLALGVVKTECAEAGRELEVDGARVTVLEVPPERDA